VGKNNFLKSIIIYMLTAAVILIIAVGCRHTANTDTGSKKVDEDNDKITVAVTIVPQKTFVEKVCGELAEVIVMVPPGNSPANYEPKPIEIEQFSRASIYFAIGVPAEEANILPRAAVNSDIKIVRLQEEVANVYADREFEPGERDPHIWLSPERVKVMVQVISSEMASIDEKNADTYIANANRYVEQLDELDRQIEQALEGVKNRKFIVFHPAFGYLADDYGLQMYALEEEGKEATPERLKNMIDLAKRESIRVIFYQAEIDSRQSESFAEEIGGSTIQLDPLSSDYIKNYKKMAELMAENMR
jgi:zinc transport system substrate-binding protein